MHFGKSLELVTDLANSVGENHAVKPDVHTFLLGVCSLDFSFVGHVTLFIHTVNERLGSDNLSLRALNLIGVLNLLIGHKVKHRVKQGVHIMLAAESINVYSFSLLKSKMVHRCGLEIISCLQIDGPFDIVQ